MNILILEKDEIQDNTIKNIRNFFRLKNEKQAIKDRATRDARNLFEYESNYYRSMGVVNFWNKNYIE